MVVNPQSSQGRTFYSIGYAFERAVGEDYPEHFMREVDGKIFANQIPEGDTNTEEFKEAIGSFNCFLALLEQAEVEGGILPLM